MMLRERNQRKSKIKRDLDNFHSLKLLMAKSSERVSLFPSTSPALQVLMLTLDQTILSKLRLTNGLAILCQYSPLPRKLLLNTTGDGKKMLVAAKMLKIVSSLLLNP